LKTKGYLTKHSNKKKREKKKERVQFLVLHTLRQRQDCSSIRWAWPLLPKGSLSVGELKQRLRWRKVVKDRGKWEKGWVISLALFALAAVALLYSLGLLHCFLSRDL